MMKKILGISLAGLLLCGNAYALLAPTTIAACTEKNSYGHEYANEMTILRAAQPLANGDYTIQVRWDYGHNYIVKGNGTYSPLHQRLNISFVDDNPGAGNASGNETFHIVGEQLISNYTWQEGGSGSESCQIKKA